jgi:hypothetical protein
MRTEFSSEDLKGRNYVADLVVDGRIILNWVLINWGVRTRIGFIWPKISLLASI